MKPAGQAALPHSISWTCLSPALSCPSWGSTAEGPLSLPYSQALRTVVAGVSQSLPETGSTQRLACHPQTPDMEGPPVLEPQTLPSWGLPTFPYSQQLPEMVFQALSHTSWTFLPMKMKLMSLGTYLGAPAGGSSFGPT